MEDSMAHPRGSAAAWTLPGWKTAASTAAALLLAILFVVSGAWKITDPFNWAARLHQLQVPGSLSLAGGCVLGVVETFAGVLIVVPRFRRWGAWLSGALLLFFMAYIGWYYNVLRGEECNCFPWVKRAVGPAFFAGDAVMLALAAVAGWWARPSRGLRSAVLVLAAVAVFAGVSLGVNAYQQSSIVAPSSIQVDGKPFPLREGRVLLYFFDPACTHCDAAAREMSNWEWNNVRVIGVATDQPQFGDDFMRQTGLRAPLSSDLALLRKSFSFVSTPYAVALENGRTKGVFANFDGPEPAAGLRKIAFIK